MIFILEGRIKHKKAVDVYIQNLLKALNIHRRYASELSIKFVKQLPGDVLGLACGGPRWGEVEIARTSLGEKIPYFEQMITIAHEMIHIKQYMKGELSSSVTSNKIPYKTQSWELEAHNLEHEYFAKAFPWDMIKF